MEFFMEEKKTDLRIQKTYKALCDTFLNLLSEKRFEEITVNELCEQALVRRATFYKHFADKYEFFGFFIRQIQESFNAEEQKMPHSDKPHAYFIYLFEKCIHYFKQHEKLVNSVIKSNMFPTLLEIFSEEVYRHVLLKMKEQLESGVAISISVEMLATFYTGGIIQVLRHWFMSNCTISEEELLREVEKIIICYPATAAGAV